MNVFRFTRLSLLVAVFAVPLACGTQTAQNSTPPTTTDLTANPSIEPTGLPEPPQPTGGGGTSISLPGLPIGRDGGDDSQAHQCVIVSWLGQSDVPNGVSVVVTGVRITPEGVFDKGSGCDGRPNCASFAFTSQRTECSVSVTAKRTAGKSAKLTLAGKAQCPAGQAQKCKDFAAQVTGKPIELWQPQSDEQSPSDESPPSFAG